MQVMEEKATLVYRKEMKLRYLVHLPAGYRLDSEQKWPFMIFLHGAGLRGDDLELVKQEGPPKRVAEGREFPFIIVAPQCPLRRWWPEEIDSLRELLLKCLSRYPIDTSRIYLTGLSMGGFGTWHLAAAHPKAFAAIVPVCGGALHYSDLAERIAVLSKVPIWVFHGADDETVPLAESQKLVDALKAAGGNVRFTVYAGVGHDSWTQTYANPEVYDWMLQQRNESFEMG
jgi:predicted peptidase